MVRILPILYILLILGASQLEKPPILGAMAAVTIEGRHFPYRGDQHGVDLEIGGGIIELQRKARGRGHIKNPALAWKFLA